MLSSSVLSSPDQRPTVTHRTHPLGDGYPYRKKRITSAIGHSAWSRRPSRRARLKVQERTDDLEAARPVGAKPVVEPLGADSDRYLAVANHLKVLAKVSLRADDLRRAQQAAAASRRKCPCRAKRGRVEHQDDLRGAEAQPRREAAATWAEKSFRCPCNPSVHF